MKNKKEIEEISYAISLLKKNGVSINFPDELKKQLDNNILFEGNDILFKKLVSNCKNYLEYGSGKSTLWAIKNTNCNVYSVETDPEWVNKINTDINETESKKLNLKYLDIGEVKNYGRPVSYEFHKNFYSYTNFFWDKNIDPDFILIDGRFRVCSFLTCIKYASEGTQILFDDYCDRQYYHIVENFIKIAEKNFNQALFIKNLEII
jgi:hypothetical protein